MCFGMTAYLCVHVWDEMEEALPKGAMIFHLLWSLMFLKVYGMEDTMAADRILVFTFNSSSSRCSIRQFNVCLFVSWITVILKL